jgi:hypothetical protein
MIKICDNRGVCIDHIEDLLKHQNIAVMISEGPDSALALYLMAKYIDELNLHDSHTLLPIHYHCTNINLLYPLDSTRVVVGVVNIIRNLFPKVYIFDPLVKDYFDLNTKEVCIAKRFYWKDYKKRLKDCGFVDSILMGGISDPYDEIAPPPDPSEVLDDPIFKRAHEKHKGPLMMADKRFIGWYYKKFNLMENLFPLTRTCVFPSANGYPCTRCSGCREKYYGFGCYDKGVKEGRWNERYSYYDYDAI